MATRASIGIRHVSSGARLAAARPPARALRGSEFIAGVWREWSRRVQRRGQTRAGRELSQANLDALRALQAKLQGGHDTMGDAMRELANFLDEKVGTAGGNDSSATLISQAGVGANLGSDVEDGSGVAGVDTADAHPPSRGHRRVHTRQPGLSHRVRDPRLYMADRARGA